MTQASNLAKAIDKLMQSKLDSSLRERYFVISPSHSRYITGVNNLTTGRNSVGNMILIGPDDIIRINLPAKEYEEGVNHDEFEGTISEAIELGYVKGNFIFTYGDVQVETGQG